MSYNSIDFSQALDNHEPTGEGSSSITNPIIRATINRHLGSELTELILNPIGGIQKIRKVLHRFGLDLPALYDLNPEGDELVFVMDQYNKVRDSFELPHYIRNENDVLYYLYLLYYLTDEGYYDFYCLLTDKEGIEEIIRQDKEEDQTEESIKYWNTNKDNVV